MRLPSNGVIESALNISARWKFVLRALPMNASCLWRLVPGLPRTFPRCRFTGRFFHRDEGHRNGKLGSTPGHRPCIDGPTVAVRNPPGNRQAEASTAHTSGPDLVRPPKPVEDVGKILVRDSDSGVDDSDDRPLRAGFQPN